MTNAVLLRFVFEPQALAFLTEKKIITGSHVDFVWPANTPLPIEGDMVELSAWGGISLKLINRCFVVAGEPSKLHISALMGLTVSASQLPTGKPSVLALRKP